MKRCSKCREKKDLDKFSVSATSYLGVRPECKECHNAARRAERALKPKTHTQIIIDGKKPCSTCKNWKLVSEYSKANNTSTGLHSQCKVCKCASQAFYSNDPLVQLMEQEVRVERKLKAQATAKEFVKQYLQQSSCVDCGINDWVVLEFDHIEKKYRTSGNKRMGVAQMMANGFKLETIAAEVEKCEVRCRNCHARKTYEREGSWRIEEVASSI